jgi:FkbM family methyltransferase
VGPWVIKARSLARKMGLIRLINRISPSGTYEKRAHQALARAVKPGDVVWDVGANVGVYSELFCQWVGEDGLVVAFEPWAESCERIRERVQDCAWLQVENIALGEADANGRLVIGAESVENHIETEVYAPNGTAATIPVVICQDDTVRNRLGRTPNVIKVDVEGFEEEVLGGMGELLTSSTLRSVLVEVHFLKLEERGKIMAPNRIQKLLDGKGFRTRWIDGSHLYATR